MARISSLPETALTTTGESAAITAWPWRIATMARGVRRSVVAQACAMWLMTRIVYLLFLLLAYVNPLATSAAAAQAQRHSLHDMLNSWYQFDVYWFIGIAQRGYYSPASTAFFPLYPMLINLTAAFLPKWLYAALIVSNLGTLLGFIGVALLANEIYNRRAAVGALLALAAYPLAFFTFAPYSEGLFLGFATMTLYCARRGAWRWVAVWGFLAGLTRPTGVILILPILWEFARQHGWLTALREATRRRLGDVGWRDRWLPVWQAIWQPRALLLGALALVGVPLAIGGYMTFLLLTFHDPFAFLHAEQSAWSRHTMPLWQAVPLGVERFLLAPPWTYWQARTLLDFAPLVIFFVVTLVAARRQPVAFTLFMLGLFYLSVTAPLLDTLHYYDPFISTGRFMCVAAPVFITLGRWMTRRPWLEQLIVGGGFMLQALLMIYFLRSGRLI